MLGPLRLEVFFLVYKLKASSSSAFLDTFFLHSSRRKAQATFAIFVVIPIRYILDVDTTSIRSHTTIIHYMIVILYASAFEHREKLQEVPEGAVVSSQMQRQAHMNRPVDARGPPSSSERSIDGVLHL